MGLTYIGGSGGSPGGYFVDSDSPEALKYLAILDLEEKEQYVYEKFWSSYGGGVYSGAWGGSSTGQTGGLSSVGGTTVGGTGGSTGQTGISVLDGPRDDRYLPGYTDGLNTFGQRLIETGVAFSLYGTPIPITFGQRKMQGNIIWATDLQEARKVKTSGGVTTTSYEYYGTFAVSFGIPGNPDAVDTIVEKIWADGRLIYDVVESSINVGDGVVFTFYKGTSTQTPDPTIEAVEGSGNVPSYTGIMYMVFDLLPLKAYGDRIPAITVQLKDADSIAASVTTIAAGGSAGQRSIAIDLDYQAAFTLNNDEVWTYDLATDAYVHQRTIDPLFEYSTNGGAYLDQWLYMDWIGTGVCMSDTAAITGTWLWFDPYTGATLDTFEMRQSSSYAASPWTDARSAGYTVLASSSVFGQLTFVVKPNGYGSWVLEENASGTWDASSPLTWGDPDSPSGISCYIMNGSVNTSIDKIYLPSNFIKNSDPDLPVAKSVTSAWHTYDGVGSPTSIDQLIWNNVVDYLIVIYNTGEICAVNAAGSSIWRIAAGNVPAPSAFITTMQWHHQARNGDKMAIVDVNTVYEVNLRNGTWEEFTITASTSQSGRVVSVAPSSYILSMESVGDALTKIKYKAGTGTLLISTMIEKLALRAGFELSEIDIDAGVDDSIGGAVFTETTSLLELIETLKTLYAYDIFESGSTLKVSNNLVDVVSPQHTIDDDDILDNQPAFTFRREEDVALPKRVELTYLNDEIGFEWATARAQRAGVQTTNESENFFSIQVPFIMSSDKAKKLAYRMLYNAWSSRENFAFALGREFVEMEPGDIVQATIDSEQYNMRVLEISYTPEYQLNIAASSYVNYEDFFVRSFAGYNYNTTLEVAVRHFPLLLDTPYLSLADISSAGTSAYYFQTYRGNAGTTYEGGSFYITDTALGQSYTNLGPGTTLALPWGMVSTTGPIAPFGLENALDRESTINFTVIGGNSALLVNKTYAQAMADTNLIAVGHPGCWELMRFLTVTLEADGSYTLSNLIRGQFGTYENARILAENYVATGTSNGRRTASTGLTSGCRAGDLVMFIDTTANLERAEYPFYPPDGFVRSSNPAQYALADISAASDQKQLEENRLRVRFSANSLFAPAVGNSISIERSISTGACTVNWNPAYIREVTLNTSGEPDTPILTDVETGLFYLWIAIPEAADRLLNKDAIYSRLAEKVGNAQTTIGQARGIGHAFLQWLYYNDARLDDDFSADTRPLDVYRYGPLTTADAAYVLSTDLDDLLDVTWSSVPALYGAHSSAKLNYVWVAITQVMDDELSIYGPGSYIHTKDADGSAYGGATLLEERPDGRAQWHHVYIKDV